MKRIIIAIHVKKLIYAVIIFAAFIIFLAFAIGGGKKGAAAWNITPFKIRDDNVIFDSKNKDIPKIKVYLSGEQRVVELNLEEYVRGVVSSEMPAEFSLEALKAQAVAARTYAAAHMDGFGGNGGKSDGGADVDDTVQCQVYRDKEQRLKLWNEKNRQEYWDKISKAVESTSGEILTYDGELCKYPLFFSVSSGKTENCAEVFSSDVGYLKSVESKEEEDADKRNSTVALSLQDFVSKINQAYPNAKVSTSKVKNQVSIKDRTEAGGVKSMKVGSETTTGPEFRKNLGLNSANFSISYAGNKVTISCRGYGHGVGMSQWGANAMAKSGKNYKDILKHYYQGVEIQKYNQ